MEVLLLFGTMRFSRCTEKTRLRPWTCTSCQRLGDSTCLSHAQHRVVAAGATAKIRYTACVMPMEWLFAVSAICRILEGVWRCPRHRLVLALSTLSIGKMSGNADNRDFFWIDCKISSDQSDLPEVWMSTSNACLPSLPNLARKENREPH